jgi:hypothetical protein
MLSPTMANQTNFMHPIVTAITHHATKIAKSEKPPKGKLKKRKGKNWLRVTSQINPY